MSSSAHAPEPRDAAIAHDPESAEEPLPVGVEPEPGPLGWLKPGEVGTEPYEIIPGKQLSPIAP